MKFIEVLACFALTLAIGVLMAVVLLEWLSGCGEPYTDSQGRTHLNECIFINLKEQSND